MDEGIDDNSGRHSGEVWSAPQPSRAHHNIKLEARNSCDLSGENLPLSSMAMEAGAARCISQKVKGARRHEHNMVTAMPTNVAEHRQGWGHMLEARPIMWSETKLDRMMDMYESQITNDHFAAGNYSSSAILGRAAAPSLECASAGDDPGVSHNKLVGTSSDLKRKRLELAICEPDADPGECGWSHPLTLLVRKGLSVSDVGELGRIIIPKRLAESKFQHLDAKEGTLLEMEDYNGLKRWFFKFKWWTNNKSRMYVLENTGEFIKYHSLKEHDIFAVYEDNVKKLVVRGHKGTDLDDESQGIINSGSSSEKSLTYTKEEGLSALA